MRPVLGVYSDQNRGVIVKSASCPAPALVGLLFLVAVGITPVIAADLPVGFIETVAYSDIVDALDFDWDPDGGVWIASKGGRVWVGEGDERTPTGSSCFSQVITPCN